MLPADSPFARLPDPGPHPAGEELRAYAAGSLTPAEEYRIELHTQDCERCADVVDGFAMTDATTTDQAVATLRTRLQARVGTAEPDAAAVPWAWHRLAAAVALLGLAGGGVWTFTQHQVEEPATARLETGAPAAAPAAPAASVPRPVPPLPQAPPTAIGKAAPKVPARPDYAVVLPAKAPKSSRAGRLSPASPVISEASPAPVVLADAEEVTADKPVASEAASQSETSELDAKQSVAASASAPSPLMAKRKAEANNASRADDATGEAQDRAVAPAPAVAAPAPGAGAPVGRGPGMRMPAAPSIGPAPVAGIAALRDYVRRQVLAFEPETKEPARSGTVRVRFLVGADGKLSELKVVRSLGPVYDAEALRIVGEGPAWRPGIAGGRRAPLPAEVDVSF